MSPQNMPLWQMDFELKALEKQPPQERYPHLPFFMEAGDETPM